MPGLDLSFFRRKIEEVEAPLPNVTVKISPRARRMALRLDPAARRVHLIVPARTSLKRAYDFARTNAEWIERRLASLPPPVPFQDGAVLPFLGKDRKVRVIQDLSLRTTRIEWVGEDIQVSSRSGEIEARLLRWIKAQAQDHLETLAQEKAEKIECIPRSVQIRDTKSRWGSCSPEGDLNFSWRLAFAPVSAMDYVVAHEVAHMRHMNHGPAFWALCRDLSVDFLSGRRWMRQSGHTLMRYGLPV